MAAGLNPLVQFHGDDSEKVSKWKTKNAYSKAYSKVVLEDPVVLLKNAFEETEVIENVEKLAELHVVDSRPR